MPNPMPRMILMTNPNARRYDQRKPGPGILEQLRSRRDSHPGECPFRECEYSTPDFDVLDADQERYFLYFRDRFLEGEALRSERGYAWLLMVDLVNREDDPGMVMEALRLMYERSLDTGGYPAPDDVDEASCGYALRHGMPLPRCFHSDPRMHGMMVSELLLPTVEPIPEPILERVCGYPLGESSYDVPSGTVAELFNASLPGVEARLRDVTGKGIMDNYGGESVTEMVTVFDPRRYDPIPYEGDREVPVRYTDHGQRLTDFLGAMYRYCVKVVEKDLNGGRGPPVSTAFDKDMRRIVDDAYNGGKIRAPEYPPKSAERPEVPEEGPVMPLYIEQPNRGRSISDWFRFDIKTYLDKGPEGPSSYVPSGSRNPEYRSLTPEALEYYLFWRECAREGRYITADYGYLWLYQCELINSGSDHGYVLGQLAGLSKAYDRYVPCNFLSGRMLPGQTYIDYCIYHGIPVPDFSVIRSPFVAYEMMDRILEGDTGAADAGCMLLLGDVTDKTTVSSFDDDCAEIAAAVLCRVDDELRGRRTSIVKRAGVRSKTLKGPVFDYLEFYGWPSGRRSRVSHRFTGYTDSESFVTDIKALDKEVARAVRNRGKARRKPSELYIFGVDAGRILDEEVEGHFLSKGERGVLAGVGRQRHVDAIPWLMRRGRGRTRSRSRSVPRVQLLGHHGGGFPVEGHPVDQRPAAEAARIVPLLDLLQGLLRQRDHLVIRGSFPA